MLWNRQSTDERTYSQRRLASVVRSTLTTLLVGVTACSSVPRSEGGSLDEKPPTGTPLVIRNVTVIDVVSGAELPAMTVVTRGDQIVDFGTSVTVPSDALQVDGTGQYLIPGLWDMHAHHQATGVEATDLFVAKGVTGTRDMGGDLDFILPLRDRIRRGEVLGPEIVAAGPILDAAPADWPYRQRVTDSLEAIAAVGALHERGVDFIKVHDHTPREAFVAIAAEARAVGLPLAGHVPGRISIEEAAASGMRSIEHLSNFQVFMACSGGPVYSRDRCADLFASLASNGVWQTPTVAFFRSMPETFSGRAVPHAAYASESLLELMRKNAEASSLSEEALAFLRAASEASLGAIRDLVAGGSGVLAGCDGLVPGFCLHDELEWLTKAGLSPLQALQTATVNPARFLGREATQGTIERGKRADLVLLAANPLQSIDNVRRIEAVVVRGRLLRKAELDRIVASHRRPDDAPGAGAAPGR